MFSSGVSPVLRRAVGSPFPFASLVVLATACGGTRSGGSGDGPPADTGRSDGGTSADGGLDCSVHAFSDASIPLRDGLSLAATVRAPTNPACKLPVVVLQTPYDRAGAQRIWLASGQSQPLFESRDYAFVIVDMRGFFGSLPAAKVPLTPAQDGYDVVEWAAAQPWSSGAVGTWGVSALGVQQYQTASAAPPHLKAAVPIFCQARTTYGQFYPGGVLRREYNDFLTRYFGSSGAVLQYPYDGPAWNYAASLVNVGDIAVPVLVVAGWYDLYPAGSFETFAELIARGRAGSEARLLVGPWIHAAMGGERSAGRELDPEELRFADGDRKVQRDSLAFFDRHLRGLDGSPASSWAAVRVVAGGVAVADEGFATWPPVSSPRTLYFTTAGELAATPPAEGSVGFPYDPSDPSPTVGGGTLLGTLHHGPTSQAAVLARADRAAFTSEPLPEALRIGGRVAVTLEVSTTAMDTDVAVRLTDVDAAGTHTLIGEGIRRLKLVANPRVPTLVPPGQRVSVPVPLLTDLAYTFAAGHRVGVIVSNSNYPRFDRNPTTGADFLADGGVPPRASTTTLFTGGVSRIVLPVR